MDIAQHIPSFFFTVVAMALLFLAVSSVRGGFEKKEKAKKIAANPELGEPVTDAEKRTVEEWLDEQALPYTGLSVVDEAPDDLIASHIGGGAAAPRDGKWPLDKSGQPMLLLAQINLGELSLPHEFPKQGVLQFFIQSDDLFGLNFDDPTDSDSKVLWYPDSKILEIELRSEHDFKEDYSPFNKAEYWSEGRKLKLTSSSNMRPEWGVWFVEEKVNQYYDRAGGEDMLEELFEEFEYEAHRLGGHPSFTQSDPRGYGNYEDYNRVLLQIGCDDFIMFGDSGECTFFITEADLRARNFDNVLYNWDCC